MNFRSKNVVKVGEWRPNVGLKMNSSEQIVWNGQAEKAPTSSLESLKGTKLRLGITHEPPFIIIDKACQAMNVSDKSCYTGLCIELVGLLEEILHFEFDFIESEDKVGKG